MNDINAKKKLQQLSDQFLSVTIVAEKTRPYTGNDSLPKLVCDRHWGMTVHGEKELTLFGYWSPKLKDFC